MVSYNYLMSNFDINHMSFLMSRRSNECYKIPGDQSDETSCVQIGVKSLNSNLVGQIFGESDENHIFFLRHTFNLDDFRKNTPRPVIKVRRSPKKREASPLAPNSVLYLNLKGSECFSFTNFPE